MNYTAKDIEKAKELKSMGYNWVATNKNGSPFAYGRMPYRCADDDSNEYNIWDNQPGTPWLLLSKECFKSITWENEPVYIDEIIAGGKVQANGDTAIERLTAENADLQKRLENAVELPCKLEEDFYIVEKDPPKIREEICTDFSFYEFPKILIQNRRGDCYELGENYGMYFVTLDKKQAEARLAELKGDGE